MVCRTVFQLDENGDVSWKVCDDAESMPFFSCETYEVSLGNPAILKLFATFAGSIIAFKVGAHAVRYVVHITIKNNNFRNNIVDNCE